MFAEAEVIAGNQDGRRMFTAVDLFAGCGGLTSGLRQAGFNVVAAIEKDAQAAGTYVANHPDVHLYLDDIRNVEPASLVSDIRAAGREGLDLLAGCPPCQGFTRLTEKHRQQDPRNELIREYLRFALALRPRACMLENVPGLLTRGKGLFEELRAGLESAGYRVTFESLELANYGVPQFRKRLLLLAGFGGEIALPRPTHCDPADADVRRLRPWRTVREAIAYLPRPPLRSRVVSGKTKPKYSWHFARNLDPLVRLRLEYARTNGRSRDSLPPSLRLACHERRPDGYHDVYGVMAWDEPSPTVTSGCTNASKGRFGHPSQLRPLTPREAALLQTFPVTYRFKGAGVESVAVQIGNALPRRFAKVVGRHVAKWLTTAPDGRQATVRACRDDQPSSQTTQDDSRCADGITSNVRGPEAQA